jgi:hypothetical protein
MSVSIKGRIMNYTLIGADCRTHLKIAALAILATVVPGFAAHGGNLSSPDRVSKSSHAVAKPHPSVSQSWARVESVSVCRINAL